MRIDYHYELDFELENVTRYSDWLTRVIESESKTASQIDYIFCDDAYLLGVNKKYLNHSTYTDIITFDYTEGNVIAGDVFISVERVKENAINFEVSFVDELKRVMVHGVLHLLGYGDKTEEESVLMRSMENQKMKLFHVEQ